MQPSKKIGGQFNKNGGDYENLLSVTAQKLVQDARTKDLAYSGYCYVFGAFNLAEQSNAHLGFDHADS